MVSMLVSAVLMGSVLPSRGSLLHSLLLLAVVFEFEKLSLLFWVVLLPYFIRFL